MSKENHTHVFCQNRFKKEGRGALCCECHPHENCGLEGMTERLLIKVIKELKILNKLFRFSEIKLSPSLMPEFLEIKNLRAKGLTYKEIGNRYHLSKQRIHQIINGV